MRKSGILMHISSLPSDYGIGTMGKEAYKFVDFLKSAKQKCWQILPIGPTSYGDSPYQSFSTNAGNPYFIDMDILREEGLLKKSDYSKLDWGKDRKNVDYETIYENRFKVLKIAFEEFKKGDLSEFYDFLQKNERWISNYALFMSIKNENDGKSWLDSTRLTVASSWLGIIMYTFQIYFDFSGYSDMAIGLGRMLGFHFGENFEYPYISRSITEFWRRWHISLSTFFRDYVYIPLGGNRYHAIRNIFIVWLLTGLWHGASWNFIFWGLFYGVLLFIEKTLFKKKLQKIPAPFCYIYTMFFVILGWALFYFTDLNALWTFIKSAFGVGTALYDLTAVSTFCTNAWLIAVCVIASTPIPTIIHKNFCKKSKVFAAISEPVLVIVGLGVCFVLLVGQTYNPFLYFRF